VARRDRVDLDAGDQRPVTGHHLDDLDLDVEGTPRRVAEPARDHEHGSSTATVRADHTSQRRRVEVIRMPVRDEDDVDAIEEGEFRDRTVALERAETVAQERIGQDADAADLDEDRGVADVPEADP
jgi:hypothetical protein